MIINLSVLKLMPYRLQRMVNFGVRVRLNGQELVIPASMHDGLQNVFWTRSWKTEVIDCLVNADDGLFVDVGANVGQTLLDLYLVNPEAHYLGFEPNVACVDYLNELIRINSLPNYRIVPVGLAEESNCRLLFRHQEALTDSCGSIISDLRPSRVFDTDIIPCFRFDEVRQDLALGKVGFVKIDVEGAELEALIGMEGSIQGCRPLVLCEVLFTDDKADLAAKTKRNNKLMGFLSGMSYTVLQLIKSDDVAHIVDAKKIQEFPSAYWTTENKELCDYLFIPEEKETDVLSSLLAKNKY